MVGASLRAARCRWLTTRHFLAPVAVLAFISINWRLVAADCSGGLFQTQVKYVTSDGPHGATLADFNRDGDVQDAVAIEIGDRGAVRAIAGHVLDLRLKQPPTAVRGDQTPMIEMKASTATGARK